MLLFSIHGTLQIVNAVVLAVSVAVEILVGIIHNDGFPIKGAVFHSDRGSQYTSAAFRAELSRRGMVQSLSGTGHCFDNARMESFFATLKKEKIYQIAAYKLPREQVKTIIFRYIFIYYNRVRVYTRNPLGLPPVKYREWMRAQQAA